MLPIVGTLMGLTNTFATLPGFIGPAVVGAITYRNVSAACCDALLVKY